MLFSLGHGQHVAVQSEAKAPATRDRAAGGDASPPTEPLAAVAPGVAQMAAQSARELVDAGQAGAGLLEREVSSDRAGRHVLLLLRDGAASRPKRPTCRTCWTSWPRRW